MRLIRTYGTKLRYRIERNTIIKLIRVKKKEYYENIIELNKGNPRMMKKNLKRIIRSESGSKQDED